MNILKKSMLIEPHDNVAVAVEPIEAGEATLVAGEELTANQFIKEGHKIARVDIPKGGEIIKYGVHIGVATQDIKKGDWVHENNVYDDFEEINQEQRAYYRSMAPDALDYTDKPIYTKEELHLPETIMGYKRAGRLLRHPQPGASDFPGTVLQQRRPAHQQCLQRARYLCGRCLW